MLTLDDFEFDKTTYDKEELFKAENENIFMHIGIELFKELCQFVSVLGCIYQLNCNNEPRLWTRDEAILGGLMIRCLKLMIGYLDNICQKRMEIADIIQRSLAETVINLKYLMTYKSPQLFEEYVIYSLRSEKKLLEEIEANIIKRGYEEPIEKRMKRSIYRSFEESGVTPDQVDSSSRLVWGGSIYKRFEKLGYNRAYLGIFGLKSHSVHGNWQEVLSNHLEYRDGLFAPNTSWDRPRPQSILPLGFLISETTLKYLEVFVPEVEEKEQLKSMIKDLIKRIVEVDDLHEKYCIRKMKG